MSGSRCTLGALALIAAGTWSPLAAQSAATSDSVPTFDQLARRVLTLKVQVGTLRAQLDAATRGAVGDGSAAWRPIAWRDSLEAIRSGFDLLATEVRRLRAAYHNARHARGEKVAIELNALAGRARDSFDGLARAADERSARTTITHLGASLDALLQTIAEGEACCKAVMR